jgi:sugar phosphate isomerase/epimerase
MKIGFLTDYSEEIVRWASEVGFGSLELAAGPGSPLDAEKLTSRDIDDVRRVCDRNKIEISALGFYANHLDPDEKVRKRINDYFMKLIDVAAEMDVRVICTFAGRVPELSIEENIPIFKEVFAPYMEKAERRNVKIAIENCPMMGGHPFRGINIAFTPEAWEMMFEAVDSSYLGLEYDPSHLLWLQADYIQAIRDFGDRIFHIHAKDTEIFYHKLGKATIYGSGWWRYRIPGWGEVDWQAVISALLDVGYSNNLDIEHEDPVFHGPRFKEGLLLGLKHLSQFII